LFECHEFVASNLLCLTGREAVEKLKKLQILEPARDGDSYQLDEGYVLCMVQC
jgi:hypothetical protein